MRQDHGDLDNVELVDQSAWLGYLRFGECRLLESDQCRTDNTSRTCVLGDGFSTPWFQVPSRPHGRLEKFRVAHPVRIPIHPTLLNYLGRPVWRATHQYGFVFTYGCF